MALMLRRPRETVFLGTRTHTRPRRGEMGFAGRLPEELSTTAPSLVDGSLAVQPGQLRGPVSRPTVGHLGHFRLRQLMETDMDRTIRAEATVTSKMISDLIVTFVESGGYISWCSKVRFFTWTDEREPVEVRYGESVWGDKSTFYDGRWSIDITTDDGETHRLGWKKLKWALERPAMRKQTAEFLDENYDVETADCLVQTAIFKEVIYG